MITEAQRFQVIPVPGDDTPMDETQPGEVTHGKETDGMPARDETDDTAEKDGAMVNPVL